MPSILGNETYGNVPVPCDRYIDNSLYIDDARILLSAINVSQVREQVREQLHLVYKFASDSSATTEEFLKEVEKLLNVTRVYHQVDRLKNNEK